MEFDPKTKIRKIIYEFSSDVLAEATGSDIKDKEGNLYFTGRGASKEEGKNVHSSQVYMIKFNPLKEVRK